ncbi:MAG: hypothetical protein K2W86_15990 [Sphingomonas sp.]|uniref:hypothetical protein n=1 Tax=Sphingomonas sp. TaxID=28214 RepID=UPI0035A8C43B|nr:hypothetical protein [Sphingomonas sp.]
MRQGLLVVMVMLVGCTAGGGADDNQAASDPAINSANVALADPAPAPSTTAASPLLVALVGDGLQLVDGDSGKTYAVPFGTAQDQAIERIGKVQGPIGDSGDYEECGAGPIFYADFPGKLTLLFQDKKFAGWSVGGPGADAKLTTLAGIGVGSTRTALEAAYTATIEESTIGIEFMAGDMSGLLDSAKPTAKISDLWAGVTCIAR